jgi:hypothetical protein
MNPYRLTTMILAAALLSTVGLGCGAGRHVQKGINHYTIQNYAGAMMVWQELEQDEGALNDKGLVRYLVYRGLTHYRLGHRQWAQHFLARGKQAYRGGDPAWLPGHAIQQMEQALAALGGGSTVAPPAARPQPTAPPPTEQGSAPEPVTIQ